MANNSRCILLAIHGLQLIHYIESTSTRSCRQVELRIVEKNLPALKDGEALVKTLYVDKYVRNLQKNEEMRKHLCSCGYAKEVWEEDYGIAVEVEAKRSVEENNKAALLGVFVDV